MTLYTTVHKIPDQEISGDDSCACKQRSLVSEAERLSAIIATQQTIATSTLNRDALMELIVERAQDMTQAEGAAFEFHEEGDMVYRACCGNTAPFLGMRLPVATSLSGKCVLGRQMLRCDDSETDPRVDRTACRKIGVRSMIVVPLLYGQEVVGVLKVLSSHPDFFVDSDVQTLELMAGLFGAVVHQAQEFDAQRERHRAQLEELNRSLRRAITETHHRMKNSLQVLLAMLDMELMDKPQTVAASRLEHLSANVRALALLHDILTQHCKVDWQVSALSTKMVLSRLTQILRETLNARIQLTECADATLSLGRGTALALLTNELVMNAVRHGRGRVQVRLTQEAEQLCFSVEDEGEGFAPNFDPLRRANTGLEMVMTLVQHDLGGDIRFENRDSGGARVAVAFAIQGQEYGCSSRCSES